MGFSRHEYWNGLPFPSPGNLPDPGIKLESPALAGGFFTTEPPRKPYPGSMAAAMAQECSQEELPYIQGKEQGLCFAGAAVKRYLISKVRETQVTWEALREGISGQTDGNHNDRQLANLIP